MPKVIALYGSEKNKGCGECDGSSWGGRFYLIPDACDLKLMLYQVFKMFTTKCNKIIYINGFLLTFFRYPSVFMVIWSENLRDGKHMFYGP